MNLLELIGYPWRRRYAPRLEQISHWQSAMLKRNVKLDIYLPPNYTRYPALPYPLLLINDGQDLARMGFRKILSDLYRANALPEIIIVGIHAGPERIREYGVTRQADYKGRGDLAVQYSKFVFDELMPFLYQNYPLTELADYRCFAGFSLGGLSALDIVWNNPHVFSGAGIFSGALWWRWAESTTENPDSYRIMHDIIINAKDKRPNNQYFWFQNGTLDEEEDRNNNGVIDAIDDTLDCIGVIKAKGYADDHLRYHEIENGTHDPETWGVAMPHFLVWMFGY